MTAYPHAAAKADLEKATSDFDRALVAGAAVVASILSHSDAARPSPKLLKSAVSVAKRSVGRAAVARGCRDDDGPAKTPVQVVRLLAEKVARESFVNLAREILEGLRPLATNPRDRGRIEVDIARYWRVQGFVDLSEAQLRRTKAAARRRRHADVIAYATLGLASCAQVRGEHGRMRRLARQGAAAASKLGLRRLASSSFIGVGAADAMARDYSSAITSLWKAYTLGRGQPLLEQEALVNLGQVLLMAGQYAAAQRLGASMLRKRLPLRFAMPTLGSYVVAAAHLGQRAEVLWAASQAERLCTDVVFPRETATLLTECALALDSVGDESGEHMKARAHRIAKEFGYLDLLVSEGVDSITARPKRILRLLPRARSVVSAVGRMSGARPTQVLTAA